MRGGMIFLRTDCAEMPCDMPPKVAAREANEADKQEIRPFMEKFAHAFGRDARALLAARFVAPEPNAIIPIRGCISPMKEVPP